jgi:hypothetical protein
MRSVIIRSQVHRGRGGKYAPSTLSWLLSTKHRLLTQNKDNPTELMLNLQALWRLDFAFLFANLKKTNVSCSDGRLFLCPPSEYKSYSVIPSLSISTLFCNTCYDARHLRRPPFCFPVVVRQQPVHPKDVSPVHGYPRLFRTCSAFDHHAGKPEFCQRGLALDVEHG